MASKTTAPVSSENTKTAKTVKPKRMGVERFMQLVSQTRGVMALLRSKYAMDVKTQEEWEITVKNLLERNAK